MAITKDVNKQTIMDMLRTDVFGFSPEDIEKKAKEAFNLVVNDSQSAGLKFIDKYGRNDSGYIVLFNSELPSVEKGKASKNKKKSN